MAEPGGRGPATGGRSRPAQTILERGLLTTHVAERGLDVTTALPTPQTRALGGWRPLAAIFERQGCCLRCYDGPTTPGGLEEAHQRVVALVRRGTLPPAEALDG